MIEKDYGTTTSIPQANTILERIHQKLGNIIRTFEVQEPDLSNDT